MVRASTKEIDIENRVVLLALEIYGVPSTKLKPTRGTSSWPDRCFWIPGGQPLLMEFKLPGKETTDTQLAVIEAFLDLCYNVVVVDNVEEGLECVRTACLPTPIRYMVA